MKKLMTMQTLLDHSRLLPIIPPSPELVQAMAESLKKRGITYEEALTQTRNSLKHRPPNEEGSDWR